MSRLSLEDGKKMRLSRQKAGMVFSHAIGLQKPSLSNKVKLDDLEYIGSLRHVD